MIESFTHEQLELWEEYADAVESELETGGQGAVVLGFGYVCQLEGVEPPSDETIRAALA